FTSSEADLQSGGSPRTLTVEVRDASENVVTGDNTTSVAFAKSSGAGTVTGLGSATAASGIASKSVTGAVAGSITIGATATGLTGDSTIFALARGAVTYLAFTSSYADLQSGGSPRTLTVEVRDASENLVTGDNPSPYTTLFRSGAGTVTGLGSATAASGIASKSVTGAVAGSITIGATATGLTGD